MYGPVSQYILTLGYFNQAGRDSISVVYTNQVQDILTPINGYGRVTTMCSFQVRVWGLVCTSLCSVIVSFLRENYPAG